MRSAINKTATLSAGVASTFDVTMPQAQAPSLATFVAKNTGGANAITTVAVMKSIDGTTFATDASVTVPANIAAGTAAVIEVPATGATVVRLSLTSTAGTTCAVQALALPTVA